jgi:hypothetical protein
MHRSAAILSNKNNDASPEKRRSMVVALFWTLFGAACFRLFLMPMILQPWFKAPLFTNYVQILVYMNVACWVNLLPAAVHVALSRCVCCHSQRGKSAALGYTSVEIGPFDVPNASREGNPLTSFSGATHWNIPMISSTLEEDDIAPYTSTSL